MKAVKESSSAPVVRGSRGSQSGTGRNRQEVIVEDMIPAFFKSIAGPHPEVPKTISGSLRFDLENGNRVEHWRLTFEKGAVSTARSNVPADCVVRTEKATMEAIIQGRLNITAAVLRGLVKIEGEVVLLALFRGLLTAPVAKTEARRIGKHTGGRS